MLYDPKWDAAQETVLEPWQQLLLDGADYIEKHGWCQHALRTNEGRVCVRGALVSAIGDTESFVYFISLDRLLTDTQAAMVHAADDALCRAVGDGSSHSAPLWNNAPERTAAEVVAKMREVALAP